MSLEDSKARILLEDNGDGRVKVNVEGSGVALMALIATMINDDSRMETIVKMALTIYESHKKFNGDESIYN